MADRPISANSSKPTKSFSGGITSAAQGEAKFQDMYEKAILRKKLFKEYIARNQVLERFNAAIEALFEAEVLPEDPVSWIADWVKANPQAVTQHGWTAPPSIPTSISQLNSTSAPPSRPVSARTGLTTRVSSAGGAAASPPKH
mmetsp:Transcript_34568/g.87420  ORF Transcript_34568/g.87420 Transcript_34568/m.87420 type:complete len:143 (-) Transcript_34568:564-992(-)|eukprot:CAMPEP_0202866944 /NCGR_PEP_ID=MMETSP1391-20130828/8443_1 /ASSEMBLY_ACC=CAM_ASM_000867 /TAXON_ID=1034604 /ORGANISM="Chlamydomonas leiostraca, Strain SAG 11-49" /LENGTH=142 /DNA_ID=CAMNT_0049546935 /DNA_START=104 /DNA_END=532 /DNA_ORIENTATION=+